MKRLSFSSERLSNFSEVTQLVSHGPGFNPRSNSVPVDVEKIKKDLLDNSLIQQNFVM